MAAPESTKWGDIVISSSNNIRQGRIGIYLEPTVTGTQVSIKVQVWFWSRYAVEDSNNTFTFKATGYDSVTRAVSINLTSNSSWSTSNQKMCYEYTYPYNRASTQTTATFTASLTAIDILGSSKVMTVSDSYTIPAISTYLILYLKNDGTTLGHTSQVKNYGETVTIVNGPTRTGYTFSHWNTKADNTGTSYNPGDTYSANRYLELHAIWTPHTYTIYYDTKGGTAVASQPKTHGVNIVLTGTPTKSKYIFKGWSTSSSATTPQYSPGSVYSQNGTTTLYAVWELGYTIPRLYNVSVVRCDKNGTPDDTGHYAKVTIDWDSDETVKSISVDWAKAGTNSWSTDKVSISASGTSGVKSSVLFGSDTVGNSRYFDSEITYSIRITVTDTGGSNDIIQNLYSQKFTIDFVYEKVLDQNGNTQSEATGVAFGKTAELTNTVEFAYDAKFDKPVYGKALGMDAVTLILAGADFNDYVDPGCYAVHVSDNVKNIANCPVPVAGRLEVWSSTGNGVQPSRYSYIRQCYHPFELKYGVMERDIHRYSGGDWQYGEWIYTKPSKVVLFVSDKTKDQETGSIPLTSAVTDFAYLEIFYTDNNGILGGYTKIDVNWTAAEETDTNKKYVDLSIVEASTSTTTMIRRTRYNISGSMLIPDTAKAGASQLNHSSTVNHQFATSNLIRITKVVGHYE